jgi:hypothetical protein
MRVMIKGIVYDSLETPVLLVFDNEWEKETFGMNRFVSAPEESTVEERQKLIETEVL